MPHFRVVRATTLFACALALGFGVACGGGDGPAGPDDPDPIVPVGVKLGFAVAPPPSVANGSNLATQPVLQILDGSGNGVARSGVTVTASLSGSGALGGTLTAATDAAGKASFTDLSFTGTLGSQTLLFTAPGLERASHALTVIPGVPARLAAVTSAPQAAVIGTPALVPPAVLVTDAAGNPVGGVVVTFAVASGGGTVVGATPSTLGTGIATVGSWILGPAVGENTLTATVEGLTGSPVTFTAVGSLLVPTGMTIVAGDGQTGTPGAPVAIAPSVRLTGLGNLPVPGVPVTFAVTAGTSIVTGESAITGANGVAVVGAWTLTGAGQHQLSATSPGVPGSPVTFTATVQALGNVHPLEGDRQIAVTGTSVALAPAVRISTSGGQPLAGVTVTWTVASGGGSMSGAQSLTDAQGIATVGSWTLGAARGVNTIEASVPGYAPSPVTFMASAVSALPVTISVHAGNNQSAPAGTTLPISPAVRAVDAAGFPVVGHPVGFEPYTILTGPLTGAMTVTDAQGIATLGSWTLYPQPALNEIMVQPSYMQGTPVLFRATGLAGPPARLVPFTGGAAPIGQVGGKVGSLAGVTVVDASGNPIAGVTVKFAIASGGGSLVGASPVSNSLGYAVPTQWTLGTTSGTQTMTAAVTGIPSVTLSAQAVGGPPVSFSVLGGDGQSATILHPVPVKPSVKAVDTYGNGASGTATFAASGGSTTSALHGTVQLDASGVAEVSWTLGRTPGAYALTVGVQGLGQQSVLGATAMPIPTQFHIDVRDIGATASQRAILAAAAARWSEVIVGDVPGNPVVTGQNTCFVGQPAINETVDDVLIYVRFVTGDGVGGMLAAAGPCMVRQGSSIPVFGVLEIDIADAARLEASGALADVVLHEMAHVMGLGTIWGVKGLLQGAGTSAPWFIGNAAVQGFRSLGGTTNNGPGVPVEGSAAGPGTADAHWRELVLGNELMTGFIGSGGNPLTAITIGSFGDLGYQVDYTTAERLAFALGVRGAARAPTPALREGKLATPIVIVAPDGTVTGQVPRR